MKCPVCDKITRNKKKCSNCGFNQLDKEFLNDSEYNIWINDTIKPCKTIYHHFLSISNEFNELKEKYEELQSEYDELDVEFSELRDEYDELESEAEELRENDKRRTNNSGLAKKSGWNYTDLVPHPNYAICSYTDDVFEIYNIAGEGDEHCYKIQFLAKMISLSRWGNGSGRVRFKWRVKDKDGIIVLTNVWDKGGLLVGDVIRGEIVLNNVGYHLYTLDFINA